MTHVLADVDEGTELTVTEIVEDGRPDVDVGDVFSVRSARTAGLYPDGSVPPNRHTVSTEHEIDNVGGPQQLKSAEMADDVVIVPCCMGGARVRVEVGN